MQASRAGRGNAVGFRVLPKGAIPFPGSRRFPGRQAVGLIFSPPLLRGFLLRHHLVQIFQEFVAQICPRQPEGHRGLQEACL